MGGIIPQCSSIPVEGVVEFLSSCCTTFAITVACTCELRGKTCQLRSLFMNAFVRTEGVVVIVFPVIRISTLLGIPSF